jgi:DNA (cytosine-5)-methyltransferase 1
VDWTKPAETMATRGARWRLVGNAVTTNVSEWLGNVLSNDDSATPENLTTLKRSDPWPAAAMGHKGARLAVAASKWPMKRKTKSIEDFLRYEPRPLSHRATSGFWQRLKASPLNYPAEFADALQTHIHNYQD